MRQNTFPLAVVLALFCTNSLSSGQQLTAQSSNSKLPHRLTNAEAIFDGEDTIYILGGIYDGDQILRYNISADAIEVVGRLPYTDYRDWYFRGSLQLDNQGNIYYLGGHGGDNVVKYDPHLNTTEIVATLPVRVDYSCSIKYPGDDENVYIFSGEENLRGVLRYNILTNTSMLVGKIPEMLRQGTCARVESNGKVYLFGKSLEKNDEPESIYEVDFINGIFYFKRSSQVYPVIKDPPGSVSTPDRMFIFSGYEATDEFPTNGIIQVDLDTLSPAFIPVENFPVPDNVYFNGAPASVFVEKLNRIYFFGGGAIHNFQSETTSSEDFEFYDIWFIDLD